MARSDQLNQLSQQLPGANQQVQKGLDEARRIQLLQNISQMGNQGQIAGPQASQQLGQQQVQQQAANAVQGMQTQQNQNVQLGQMALQQQARGQRAEEFNQAIQLSQQDRAIADKLYRIDSRMKNKLLDEQFKFNKDSANRTLFNNRQLADWAVNKAQSAEEYQNYANEVEKTYNRKQMILDHVEQTLTQVLNNNQIAANKQLDQANAAKIKQFLVNVKKEAQDNAIEAANTQATWTAGGQGIGSIIGGAIGAVAAGAFTGGLGAGAGAVVGAKIGGALGGGVGANAAPDTDMSVNTNING